MECKMSIFNVLSMIGGLALFLYGMHLMGEGLSKASGGKLESILEKLTSNPVKAVLLGAGVTAVIQSSSATTVMVVGFVNSGIMRLSQAVGIIMGANIGTTATSWILSLTGIEGDNLFVNLLKPSSFSPVLAIIGVVCIMFVKKQKVQDIGKILVGFAILMTGMDAMSSAVEPLADVPQFTQILTMFSNPVLGMLAGLVLTAIIQSSSASVGILQALCSTGSLGFATVIPIIMGQNIGTCVTALISAVGANKNAKRAALVHLYFNIIGTIVFMILFYSINALFPFSFMEESATQVGNMLVKLACLTIRDNPNDALDNPADEFSLLDERFLDKPSLAMEHCMQVTNNMAELSKRCLFTAIGLFRDYSDTQSEAVSTMEERVDRYEDMLGTYLMKLSGKDLSAKDSENLSLMLHTIGNFERISDHACNLCDAAKEMAEKNMAFSEKATQELHIFTEAVKEIVNTSFSAFKKEDVELAGTVEPLEEVIDDLNMELKTRHIRRLREGKCTIELGFAHSDILNNLERVSDHCSNIAVDVIQSDKENFDTHEYLDAMKNRDNQQFAREYKEYKEKYRLPETRKFV